MKQFFPSPKPNLLDQCRLSAFFTHSSKNHLFDFGLLMISVIFHSFLFSTPRIRSEPNGHCHCGTNRFSTSDSTKRPTTPVVQKKKEDLKRARIRKKRINLTDFFTLLFLTCVCKRLCRNNLWYTKTHCLISIDVFFYYLRIGHSFIHRG